MLVHDAARALAPASLFARRSSRRCGAGTRPWCPAYRSRDTVKVVDAAGRVTATPRARARCAPSRHRRGSGARCSSAPTPAARSATDDAALVELIGVPVMVIDGDPRAVKVTTPRDLDLARTILQEDSIVR